jgi:molybdenum cofactor cytidylyltransferase
MQLAKLKLTTPLQVVIPSLRSTLGLGETPRVAFVGAGGKSTALFHLAREYASPVVVTATSHLELFQIKQADQHFQFDQSSGWNESLPTGLSGITLFSGIQSTRSVAGLEEGPLQEVLSLADKNSTPLLIEADGSRRHPIKAPTTHEPPIPKFVDTVIVVAGLSALGKPCTAERVHRPEIYSQMAGIQPGDPISLNAMKNVLCHPHGGLKNIPSQARKIVLLNQADTPEICKMAEVLAANLLSAFDRVVVSALNCKTDAPYITGIYNTPDWKA